MNEYAVTRYYQWVIYKHFGTDDEPTEIYHYNSSRGWDTYYGWMENEKIIHRNDNMPAIITYTGGLVWYEANRPYQPYCKKL